MVFEQDPEIRRRGTCAAGLELRWQREPHFELGPKRLSRLKLWLGLAFVCLPGGLCLGGAATDIIDGLLNKSQAAQLNGDAPAALSLANKAVELDPTNAQCFYVRGRLYASDHEPAQAVADYSRALELEPRGAEIYQLRGLELFKLARFQEAIADFDTFLKFVPKQEPYHWHRGIAYYFAGRYEEGRRQFELRQSLGTNIIENALWHFLCVAHSAGLEKARASLLPLQGDPPLFMRKLYDFFAGKTTAEQLLAFAQANYASTAQLNRQLFFTHLYVSLYLDLTGDAKAALAHASQAAEQFKVDNFMGDVAVVQAQVLRKKAAP